MERPRGWTIVELTLVIAIVSILAAAVYPKFSGMTAVRGEAAGQKLLSDVRYAQRVAMARAKTHGIEFDVDVERYRVFDVGSGANAADPFSGNPGVAGQPWSSGLVVNYPTHPELKGVTLVSTNFSANGLNQLRFDSMGRPMNSQNVLFANPGQVVVEYQGYNQTLTIQPDTGYSEVP